MIYNNRLSVRLESAYFAETKNFLLKILYIKVKVFLLKILYIKVKVN